MIDPAEWALRLNRRYATNSMLWPWVPALKGRPIIEKSLRDCTADIRFLTISERWILCWIHPPEVAVPGTNTMPNKTSKKPAKAAKKAPAKRTGAKPVKLLSGGNPQIAKADGDAPVQAYIAAMPGWKHDVGRRLDALIERTVPGVRKAVKWNTPFYGIEGKGFFLGFHCMTKYIKVAFFRGTSLRPVPPGVSKQKEVRYLDIYEDDRLDEELVASWIKQAAELPGWLP
jgi:hypothetical protein